MKTVIDISEHQGTIDFKKVSNPTEGVEGVIIRDGYGKGTADSKFDTYVKGAKSVGLPIVAIYHFSYALSANDAKKEAEFAVSQAKKHNLPKDTIIFFDLEYDSVSYAKKNGVTINSKLCVNMTKTFCDTVKKSGYRTGVYFNGDYYYNYYNKLADIPSDYICWYADWTNNPNKSILNRSAIHQYSSTAHINGIMTPVDINIYDETKLSSEIKMENNTTELKPLETIVDEVFAGIWGNGEVRKTLLTEGGYDYDKIQNAVNVRATAKKSPLSLPKSFKEAYKGEYVVTADALYCRYIPGLISSNNVYKIIYQNDTVTCSGHYTDCNGTDWLLVDIKGTEAYVCSKYIKKK